MNPRAVLPLITTATTHAGTLRARFEKLTEKSLLVLGLVFAVIASILLLASPAHAATLTVNETGDIGESVVNDGTCDYSPAPGIQCTLRAAIEEANSTESADTIRFDIPGGGVKTIQPSSPLPEIREQLTINGYTQPGAKKNTAANGTNAVLKIELDGSDAGLNKRGLFIRASDCVVQGLVINRFGGNGINVGGPSVEVQDNNVRGNFIGTDPGGTVDLGNGGSGVVYYSSSIGDSSNTSNVIGVVSRRESRNLISGNDGIGVVMNEGVTNTTIAGNLIGTTKNGADALGNSGGGVRIHSGFAASDDNIVGGSLLNAANTIAFNGDIGIQVVGEGSTGNGITGNSIFENDGLGIDLGDDGTTPNDPDDPDTGPNNLQNKPNLTSAENSATATTIKGSLNSVPNRTFRIRFFSNPSGNEGKKYIGAKDVSTNASGDTGTFTFEPDNKVGANQNITATATRLLAVDTSEFSAAEEVE